jgi:hypothetical protein
MLAAAQLDRMDHTFDDSLSASLEDYEDNQTSPAFGIPSQHSGFRSESSDADAESSSGRWSPPLFKKPNLNISGRRGGFFNHQPHGQRSLDFRPSVSPSRSRETSPQYEDAVEGGQELDGDDTIAANIPLPAGTDSPWKEQSPEPYVERKDVFTLADDQGVGEPNISNCTSAGPLLKLTYSNLFSVDIRFAVRAEVQHREPIEAMLSWAKGKFDRLTQTRSSTILSTIIALLSITMLRIMFAPPTPPPVPDLVKVAKLARSFEPLIFYSENGVQQITALQETGVAVWDLGESVRSTNMTSGPLIVNELDNLSESLKHLALELTRFFANVDADVDSILIVMDWAKRELSALHAQPLSSLNSVFDNFHSLLARIPGVLEHTSTGLPTPFGRIITELFGATTPQRTRSTLARTFNEFLSVLEDSINSELIHSANLVILFNALERQFTNLHRAVVRETDTQERAEGEFLSSLWTRVLGPNVSALRKYEKNRKLLSDVRNRTIANKKLLLDHERRLHNLKEGLEHLRRKLVSPLVRRNDSLYGSDGIVSMGIVVEEQIKGLEGTYEYLKGVREKQKSKLLELVYGSGMRTSYLVNGADGNVEIEGR